MEYDTDHVRLGDGTRPSIIGISTFSDLVENSDLAGLYTILREGPMTASEVVDLATVSKKTVYSYLSELEQAGLATKADTGGRADTYRAEDFELTVAVRGVTVSITPELVGVFARSEEYPVVERVVDEHGVVPLVLAYDLVQGHSEGEITVRQIASITGLSSGTTYDLVEALYEILDLGTDGEGSTTFTPPDTDGEDDLTDELLNG